MWECWALFADRLVGEQLPVQAVQADDLGLIAAVWSTVWSTVRYLSLP